MDAFGSDRKLSELGLDLPDFFEGHDVIVDPDELFPTIASHHIEHHRRRQSRVNHVQFDLDQHHHQVETPSAAIKMTLRMNKTSQPTGSYRSHRVSALRQTQYPAHSNINIEEDYESEFQLVDVVDDDDSDEVVLDSGWLDDILDSGHQSSDHVVCTDDDDVIDGQQHVSDEHSYSINNGFVIKMESDEIDMDTGIFEMINPDLTLITGSELQSSIDVVGTEEYGIMTSHDSDTTTSSGDYQDSGDDVTCDCSIIKSEPLESSTADSVYPFSPVQSTFFDVSSDAVDLPLTPPSSSGSSSDSEAGGLSPRHSPSPSPYHHVTLSPRSLSRMTSSSGHHHHHHHTTVGGSQHSVWTASLSTNQQSYYSNQIPSSGILILSEEEKRTLVAEGYPIPSKLPLTKKKKVPTATLR